MKFLVVFVCVVACATTSHVLEKFETRIYDSDFMMDEPDLFELLKRANLPSLGFEKVDVNSTNEIGDAGYKFTTRTLTYRMPIPCSSFGNIANLFNGLLPQLIGEKTVERARSDEFLALLNNASDGQCTVALEYHLNKACNKRNKRQRRSPAAGCPGTQCGPCNGCTGCIVVKKPATIKSQ